MKQSEKMAANLEQFQSGQWFKISADGYRMEYRFIDDDSVTDYQDNECLGYIEMDLPTLSLSPGGKSSQATVAIVTKITDRYIHWVWSIFGKRVAGRLVIRTLNFSGLND